MSYQNDTDKMVYVGQKKSVASKYIQNSQKRFYQKKEKNAYG